MMSLFLGVAESVTHRAYCYVAQQLVITSDMLQIKSFDMWTIVNYAWSIFGLKMNRNICILQIICRFWVVGVQNFVFLNRNISAS